MSKSRFQHYHEKSLLVRELLENEKKIKQAAKAKKKKKKLKNLLNNQYELEEY